MAGIKFSLDVKGFKNIETRMAAASKRASHSLAEQMARDTTQYVPKLTGSLRSRTYVDGDTIIYPGPYARFLYYGKLMVDPETKSAWAPKGATKEVTGKDLQYSDGPPHGKAQAHWFEASKAQNLPKWKRVAEKAVKREFGR